MLLLDDFLKDLKRLGQYGDESVTDDEPTADLIRWINKYRRAIAKLTDWSWLRKSFDVSLSVNVQTATIDSTIDRIIVIGLGGSDTGYLQKISQKQAFKWHIPATGNIISAYTDEGLDTSGNKVIKVYGTPTSSATLPAYGHKRFDDLVVADIGTSKNFLPFPDEVMNEVEELVSARILKLKKDPAWRLDEAAAWARTRIMMGEEQSDPSDDVTSPLPEYYKLRRQMRRSGLVA